VKKLIDYGQTLVNLQTASDEEKVVLAFSDVVNAAAGKSAFGARQLGSHTRLQDCVFTHRAPWQRSKRET